jgi:radical SAM protein (TIGR01212 family)
LRKILTFGRYAKKRFGKRTKKIPLGLSGFTCPNIDGRVAKGGCTFCENESFSPNLARSKRIFLNPDSPQNPLLERQLSQIEEQYNTTRKSYEALGYELFLTYFQAFTNTYAPLDTLRRLYEHALAQPKCAGLSIGTRSDSVTAEILDYLADLSRDYEVWVEYGIQSVYDETLRRINRGHDAKNARDAIAATKKRGLKVCGHVIFGLPGETPEMMLETVRKTIEWGCDAIKFHPLYVVKNTALAIEYQKGEFIPISQERYIETLVEAIKMLPKDMVVQRVSAGIGDESLLAPAWCADKNAQLAAIRKALKKEGYLY